MSVHDGPEGTVEVVCNVEGCRNVSFGVEHVRGLIVAFSPRWSTVIAWNRPRTDICWKHELPISTKERSA